MTQLAIKGHATRGAKVIEILRTLGGLNALNFSGINKDGFYYIGTSGIICNCSMPHNRMVFTIEEFLEKFPYKVGDKVLYHCTDAIVTQMKWDGREVIYTVECNEKLLETSVFYLRPYKETMEEKLTIQDIRDDNTKWLFNKLKGMPILEMFITVNDLCNKLNNQKYPKTYEKCCEIIGAQQNRHYFYTIRDKQDYPHEVAIMNCLDNLRRLLICREAYWKIAGEEMGLGEPWRPDWETPQIKFTIAERADGSEMCNKHILAFPTGKMRDEFYENFKVLIEGCKELL